MQDELIIALVIAATIISCICGRRCRSCGRRHRCRRRRRGRRSIVCVIIRRNELIQIVGRVALLYESSRSRGCCSGCWRCIRREVMIARIVAMMKS